MKQFMDVKPAPTTGLESWMRWMNWTQTRFLTLVGSRKRIDVKSLVNVGYYIPVNGKIYNAKFEAAQREIVTDRVVVQNWSDNYPPEAYWDSTHVVWEK